MAPAGHDPHRQILLVHLTGGTCQNERNREKDGCQSLQGGWNQGECLTGAECHFGRKKQSEDDWQGWLQSEVTGLHATDGTLKNGSNAKLCSIYLRIRKTFQLHGKG